ncbi:tyrosine-type recombinase/integrase [Streptosporangium sp. NPDC001559]|uniref:tyrosine-type recombinase/integrase n=1 Tax=Streptosporangium sp. NPDC001559 TaxID=3366187 RepID=UPI0036E7CD39
MRTVGITEQDAYPNSSGCPPNQDAEESGVFGEEQAAVDEDADLGLGGFEEGAPDGGRYGPAILAFKKPKGKPKRPVPLPPLIPLLKAHRARQAAERLAAGEAWEDFDLVFAQRNGHPIDKHDDWEEWKELLTAAGVREARVHDARHTAATLLIEQGVHVRTVQEILGHSDIRVTQRYTHIASPMAQEGMERMGQALWN